MVLGPGFSYSCSSRDHWFRSSRNNDNDFINKTYNLEDFQVSEPGLVEEAPVDDWFSRFNPEGCIQQ
jgi:hypothetical protein